MDSTSSFLLALCLRDSTVNTPAVTLFHDTHTPQFPTRARIAA